MLCNTKLCSFETIGFDIQDIAWTEQTFRLDKLLYIYEDKESDWIEYMYQKL